MAFYLLFAPGVCHAGGGPENVAVIVNPDSWASLTVANEFVKLRKIPESNVMYLSHRLGTWKTNVNLFREEILRPIFQTINNRGMADRIDYIVYSADFPLAIDVQPDVGEMKLPKQLTPTASINGLTYLWQNALGKNPNYLSLQSNQYMRRATAGARDAATLGFRSWYGWGNEGRLLEVGGQNYMLSTVLAVTSGRGNSVKEAVSYLKRSAKADGTQPKGTIYFVKNNDVRSKARDPAFTAAAKALTDLGVRAQVVTGKVPNNRRDVQGAMMGTPKFDWQQSGSTILPGAICEHFTSAGGNLDNVDGQTPLTEFLRYGAAGASGTVAEPYAIGDKFPFPFLQVHYARGCTLAESFYQSVFGPYQLLIVGDPLCRPWANIPKVSVEGVRAGQTLSGTVTLTPSAEIDSDDGIARFELFIGGFRRGSCAPGDSFDLDTTTLFDGHHEIRIVAIEASAIESQGRLVLPIKIRNHDRTFEFTASAGPVVKLGDSLTLDARSPGALQIVVYHNTLSLGTILGEAGQLRISTRRLGMGPVTLRAAAVHAEGSSGSVFAKPIQLQIKAPNPMPAIKRPAKGRVVKGLKLTPNGGAPVVVEDARSIRWLDKAGVRVGQAYALDAYFDVPTTDVYQFQMLHRGPARIDIDGKTQYQEDQAKRELVFVPVALSRGTHRLQITGTPSERPRVFVGFGGPGARSVDGKRFWHTR